MKIPAWLSVVFVGLISCCDDSRIKVFSLSLRSQASDYFSIKDSIDKMNGANLKVLTIYSPEEDFDFSRNQLSCNEILQIGSISSINNVQNRFTISAKLNLRDGDTVFNVAFNHINTALSNSCNLPVGNIQVYSVAIAKDVTRLFCISIWKGNCTPYIIEFCGFNSVINIYFSDNWRAIS